MYRRDRESGARITQHKLLEAAERAFEEKGFDGARVDEIADMACVNKRMIYLYFGSKEELYRAVLRAHVERALAASRGAIDEAATPDVQLEAMVRHYFRFLSENPGFVRLLGWETLSYGERTGDVLLSDLSTMGLERLESVVQAGVDRGIFRPDVDPRQAAVSIMGLCLSFFTRRALVERVLGQEFEAPGVLDALLEHTVRLVMAGLCAADANRA
jgi:TetR/AcrR family transcriptional regulator